MSNLRQRRNKQKIKPTIISFNSSSYQPSDNPESEDTKDTQDIVDTQDIYHDDSSLNKRKNKQHFKEKGNNIYTQKHVREYLKKKTFLY